MQSTHPVVVSAALNFLRKSFSEASDSMIMMGSNDDDYTAPTHVIWLTSKAMSKIN